MIKTTSSSSSAASSIDLIDAGIHAQLFKEINKNSHTNDGIADDLIDDAFDLTNDKSNGDVLYYASTPMTSASLISFNKGGKDGETDDFLQMLADSYRGTNRNISVGGRSVSTKTVATPTTINLKLTFISTEGQGGSKSIEFSDENDYWTAISAIKRTSLGESCFASGKCQLSQGDASDITTTRSSFFSTGSKSPDCTFEIKNGKIKVMQKSTEVMSLDISNLKAMTLSADFDRSRTFILDIRLNPRSYVKNTHTEISMSVIDAEGKPLTSEYNNAITLSKLNKNDTVFVPVSEEDIQYSNLAFGASKVAIMNVDKLSGAERGIAAEVNIPFASFYFAQPGSARGGRPKISGGKLELITGEMITNAVTVRTPPNEREVSYRVVVKSASGLPLSGKKGPSAYCTIYLVNDKGEKLTTNTAESRTDVVAASCDPEWNKEFILKIDDKINVDFMYSGPLPSGVMLKIRDSASGILKHKHLGQVIIPISCFLMNTEASMCLPLDPTERMGDGQGTAGDIIFSTQLLGPKGVIPAVSPSGGDSASDYSARPKSSSIVSMTASNRRVSGAFGSRASVAMNHAPAKSDDEKDVSIGFTVRKIIPWLMWWPFRALSGGGGNAIGFFRCDPAHLILRLLPGAGGVLPTCEESIATVTVEDLRNCTDVLIPWIQVTSSVDLTDSSLSVSLFVNRLVGSPRDAGKTQKTYMEAELEVLVAPCPSQDLKLIISHRKSMAAIRGQILSLSSMLYSFSGPMSPSSSSSRLQSNPPSPREPLSPVLGRVPSPRQLVTEQFSGQRNHSSLKVSWSLEEVHQVLNMARIIAETLEEMSAESFPFLQIQAQYESRSPMSDKGKSSNDRILLSSQIYKYYRTRCYTSVLLHLCELFHSLTFSNIKNKKDLDRLIDSPAFSGSLISEVPMSSVATALQHVENDCLLASQRSPLLLPDGVNGEDFIKSLIAKFNLTLEFAVQRVRDYVLCSTAFWDSIVSIEGLNSGGGNRKSMAIRNLTVDDIEAASQQQGDVGTAKRCLQALVSGYHHKLQSMLSNYVSSKESFLKCNGQAFKTGLLKFLIDKNQTFDERLRPTFRTLGLSIEPKLFILETSKLLQVIDWYSSIVVAETKEWLANTLKHVYKTRTNKFDLPWDIEDDPNKVGDRLISDLPETLMRTLNIYLDLCTDDVDVEIALQVENNIGSSTNSALPKRFLPKGASESVHDKSRLGNSMESSTGSFALKTPRDDGTTTEPHSYTSINSPDCFSPEDFQGDIEEYARKFNEMRYRRKLGPRARFLLKVNEKIVGALLQSWNLLGNEYRRALQGKHWGQGNRESGENIANINFLLATGNDIERIITIHYRTMSNVKVFPEYSGGTTETFLRQLILNFREIEETVTKQITRIILCDLHPLLLDFHTQWVEVLAEAKANGFKASASNAAKSIVTVLTFYFKNLESFSNPVVFFKVISQCCEVVVARYILMIKERSAKSSKFSNEEVSLFCGDTDYLRKYFDEMVGQAVKRLANESSKSLASKSTDSNIDNSLFQISQEVLQARSSRALRHLADLKDLFQLDPTKEPFIAHCKSIIKRYENYPSTFGIPTMMGSYMTSVAVSVRPDGTSGVATVINNIVDSFVKYSLASFGDSDSSNIQDLLEDPVFRVYGSKSAIVNEEDSGEQSIASSQSRSISSFLSGSTVPPSPMKAPSSGNVSGTGAKTALSSSISFKNATSILSSAVSTPHTAMKMIREKAADFKLGGLKLIGGEKAKQKKLDQKTAEIFRILGIIDDGIDSIDKASDDGSDDSSDESDTSEQDNIAADDVCIVRISAVKLRGLKSGALFGSANPYVALNIGHKREKTSVIWGSKEWVWKSSISFKVSLSKLQSSKLTVKVFDKERVRRKRLLGAVTVKLAGLDVTEIQSWFALEGGDTGSNGDVYLNVQLDT